EGYNEPLVQRALKEAVLLGKLNLRYIDRILFNWKKRGLNTVKAVNASEQQQTLKREEKMESEAVVGRTPPVYNWLEQK
ncbi:MAG: DnaD domain-containing protein, partial [Bacilli bacterium]